MFLIGLAIIIFLTFGLTVLRGAPYLPARNKDVEAVLKGLELKPGDLIVDLGSGDGTVLLAAAKQGLVAYGYEINPLLCIIGWLRCRYYGKQIKILWRDFWFIDLPPETKAIFIFAAGPYMKGLAKKFSMFALQHSESFYVASYGFSLPQVGGCKIFCVSGQKRHWMKRKIEGEKHDHSTRTDRRTAERMRRSKGNSGRRWLAQTIDQCSH